MIQLGVIEAVQQVDRSGSRSREAHPNLSRELGVRTGHERGHLLVTNLDEVNVIGAVERADDPVDAVAGIAVYPSHSPVGETVDEKIADRRAHAITSSLVAGLDARTSKRVLSA